jgi:anti-sigma regulatory factor (Ser/Thr protein kinase)
MTAHAHYTARTFPDDVASVGRAREFVRLTVDDLAERDDAVLLVSELATNAVQHAHGSFEVLVRTDEDQHVWIGVADGSDEVPVLHDTDPKRDRGRGLGIVDRLATAWGVDRRVRGKVVWFTLPRKQFCSG